MTESVKNYRDGKLVLFGRNNLDELELNFPSSFLNFNSETPVAVLLPRGSFADAQIIRQAEPTVSGSFSFFYFDETQRSALKDGTISGTSLLTERIYTTKVLCAGTRNPITDLEYTAGEVLAGLAYPQAMISFVDTLIYAGMLDPLTLEKIKAGTYTAGEIWEDYPVRLEAVNALNDSFRMYNLKYVIYEVGTSTVVETLYFFNCITTRLWFQEGQINEMGFEFICLNDFYVDKA